ncbi:myotubularin-related protein 4-like [Ostrinia nubilalis]|uniref:myotubularin-related protein 4-like n=1 Tax=Ostrinia nubilalis TaxID=29057 RepID=UPI003082217E
MLINTFLDTEDFVHLYYAEDEAAPAQNCGQGARMAAKCPQRPPSPDYSQAQQVLTNGEMSERERYRAPPPPEPPPHRVRAADLYPRLRTQYDEPGLDAGFTPICGEFLQWVGRMADGGTIAMSNYRLHMQPRRRNGPGSSVPLRLIDGVEIRDLVHLVVLCKHGRQLKSNYRLHIQPRRRNGPGSSVPLRLIDGVEIRDLVHLVVLCKHGRQLKTSFNTGDQCMEWWRRLNTAMAPIGSVQETFAAAYAAWAKEQPPASVHRALMKASHAPNKHWFGPEVERLGFTTKGAWRVTAANAEYKLCPSYPPLLVVPATIGDEDLDSVARFRAMRRIPAVVWRHRGNGAVIARSSQPEVGWLGWRSSEDERLLTAFVQACNADRGLQPPSTANKPEVGWLGWRSSEDERLLTAFVQACNADRGLQPPSTANKPEVGWLGWRSSEDERLLTAFVQACNADRGLQPPSTANKPEVGWLGWRSSEDERLLTAFVQACNADRGLQPPSTANKIARSSQPEVGWLGWRSSEDERLLTAFVQACNADRGLQPPSTANKNLKLLIVDARSYASAVTNRARGGGCECQQYYPMADIQFMSLPNIHHVRRSFQQMRALAAEPSDQANWHSNLERTLWPQYVAGVLRAAGVVARAVLGGRPALVHCSDGWDRTPQIVAAAQLVLDARYRTLQGFQVLIEREWLDFGHKFADRCGHQFAAEEPNERSPIFLQWLDVVHQMMAQYPCSFEFNEAYLIKLATHVHSCMFGTFLCNTRRERAECRAPEQLAQVWQLLRAPAYRNHLYAPHPAQVDGLHPDHFENSTHLPRDIASGSSSLERELGVAAAEKTDIADLADGDGEARALDADTPEESSAYLAEVLAEVLVADTPRESGRTRNISITWRSISESSNQSSTGFDIADAHRPEATPPDSHEASPIDNHNSTDGDVVNHNVVNHNGVNGVNGVNGTVNGVSEETAKFLEVELNGGATSSSVSSESEGEAAATTRRTGGRRHGSQLTLCPASPRRASCCHSTTSGIETSGESATADDVSSCWCGLDAETGGARCVCGAPAGGAGAPVPDPLDGLPPNADPLQDRLHQIIVYQKVSVLIHKGWWGVQGVLVPDPLDGLPPNADPLQDRLHQIIVYQKKVVSELTGQLRQARELLRRHTSPGAAPPPPEPAQRGRSHSDSASSASASGSGSGSASEVEVGEEARGVVWLPDSAAPRCQHCRNHFWLARRRHHCRRCGGIFCGSCSEMSSWGDCGSVRVCRRCRTER